MVKAFYEFGDRIFRDGLWSEYIIPVARWFLHASEPTGWLLPQYSGSVWECSLSIDFLCKLYDQPSIQDDLKKMIKSKVVTTARWLIEELRNEQDVDGLSWDSAPWDSAVALRSLLFCMDKFRGEFTEDQRKKFDQAAISVCKWLLIQNKNWKAPEGYLTADTTDLAVTLSVLIMVYQKFPSEYLKLENELSQIESINAAANMLIQCVKPLDADSEFILDNWGSCFNIGEVICGLSSYILWNDAKEDIKSIANKLILAGLKRIELEQQNNGGITNNNVADSCGITWCYLVASKAIGVFEHDDTMIFRTLCWMCDSNKVMRDGSFLHTSYATVFYALSLIEIYETWELGKKSTNEVYHVIVWTNPNSEIIERAKRLDMEMDVQKIQTEADKFAKEIQGKFSFCCGIATFIISVILAIVVMEATRALQISFSISNVNDTLVVSEIAIAAAIDIAIIPVIYKISKKYAKKNIALKQVTRRSNEH